jgi:hypothetical protein
MFGKVDVGVKEAGQILLMKRPGIHIREQFGMKPFGQIRQVNNHAGGILLTAAMPGYLSDRVVKSYT